MKNASFTTSKLIGNSTNTPQVDSYYSGRRPVSLRQSQRKPIFQKNMYYSTVNNYSVKRPLSYKESTSNLKQMITDDFCGCEHNLDPCSHIQELLNGLNQKEMRAQYEQLDLNSPKISKIEMNRKYFRYLPPQYPELYLAQLSNIVSNIGRDLHFNQFIALASIEYHAKLQHLTYFLFIDLEKSLHNKKKFFNSLELSLIKYEVNYHQLVQDSRVNGIPLETFLSDYYESAGSIIVPLSQYAFFLKLLIRQGSSIKLKLMIYLVVRKKESLVDLVKSYAKSLPFLRQKSRQLPWETFLEDIKDS